MAGIETIGAKLKSNCYAVANMTASVMPARHEPTPIGGHVPEHF